MTDLQPLVCVFFQLPPSDQLFMRIHDIPWLVLLPQIDELTYALETLLITNPSSTAMKTLIEARIAMGSKMLSLRDAFWESRDVSRHYIGFVNRTTRETNLSVYIKESYTFVFREGTKKIERAQQALFEFREELESIVDRITSLVGGDNNHLSLFITKSNQILSVMIPAIEECSALFQECSEGFENIIYNQNFDPESFDRNPPSDAEYKLTREKWERLQNFLYNLSADWNLLNVRMADPAVSRAACDTIAPDVRDIALAALAGIPENPVNPEALLEFLPPKKARMPCWRKLFQRVFSCITPRQFCQ